MSSPGVASIRVMYMHIIKARMHRVMCAVCAVCDMCVTCAILTCNHGRGAT
jgi:hypothetical protein